MVFSIQKADMSDEINESYLPRAEKFIDFPFSPFLAFSSYRLLAKWVENFLSFPLLPLLLFNIIHISLHVLSRTESENLIVVHVLEQNCVLVLLRYRLFPSAWFLWETMRKKNWNTEKLFSLFIFTCVIIVSLKRHDYVHLIWNTKKNFNST